MQMIAIFTFINEKNPLFDDIVDVAILQMGVLEQTFIEYWDVWVRRGYVFPDENNRYYIRDGLIDMLKSGVPTQLGGTLPISIRKKDLKKEVKSDLQKEDMEYYRYVKDETNAGRTPKTKPEWLNEEIPDLVKQRKNIKYKGD
jgi:hypothetical protein